jgi:hypothetical protein
LLETQTFPALAEIMASWRGLMKKLGAIKLWRQLSKTPFYQNSLIVHMWIHLLISAQGNVRKYFNKIKVYAGQKGGRKMTARKLYDLKDGQVVLSETGKKYENLLKKVSKYCTANSINIDCEKLALKYYNKKITDLPSLIEEWKSQDDKYEKRKSEQ